MRAECDVGAGRDALAGGAGSADRITTPFVADLFSRSYLMGQIRYVSLDLTLKP